MTINLIDARRGLHNKCLELFSDKKIADQIYFYLCDGIEDCEEAEPIVRCKDCKHGEDEIMSGWYCLITKGEIEPDDYCSRGERMDEVEE